MRGWRRTRTGLGAIACAAGLAGVLGWSLPAAAATDRGWTYVIDKLVADGLGREAVRRVFHDPRFPAFTGLSYGLAPRESAATYRGLLGAASVASARRCLATHREALARAEERYEVPASLVAAILYVETRCGRNTGSRRILPRLARLAMANEPANRARNVARHVAGRGRRSADEVRTAATARAKVLEDMFYPEVLAAFHLAERLRIDPLNIVGSDAGAFGIPQFLPTSYLRYAVDGNGDGVVSLYQPEDAIASCANYLKGYGWRPGLSRAERRRVIWEYNHSDAYVDAILALAARLAS